MVIGEGEKELDRAVVPGPEEHNDDSNRDDDCVRNKTRLYRGGVLGGPQTPDPKYKLLL